jgi:N-methylhydantoinase A
VYTKPRMVAYLSALERELGKRQYGGTLSIMQSSGGMTSSTIARELPIRTLESGPAGGVIGASSLGRALGLTSLVAADVGGTTFDVALIIDGEPFEKAETRVNRRPVLQPTLDIVSIGAGGGSIAWLDGEGSLRVGPRSAQAVPGPACFGQGGSAPTVTDAQVVLGYLDPDYFLGNRMQLDRAAGETVIREKIAAPLHLDLIPAAQGIYRLAAMNMTYAIRNITIERGHDPREFTLVCFGGGGGLFAAHLLNELECASAIIPVNPANFSGWGLLNADYRQDLTRMFRTSLSEADPSELADAFERLQTEAVDTLVQNRIDTDALTCLYYAHLRYVGQEHTVRVPVYAAELNREGLSAVRQRFDTLHEKAYAHMLADHEVEIVRLQLIALAGTAKPAFLPLGVRKDFEPKGTRQIYVDTAGIPVDCLIVDRETLPAGTRIDGPVIVEEWASTTLVLPGQRLQVDLYDNLIITRI